MKYCRRLEKCLARGKGTWVDEIYCDQDSVNAKVKRYDFSAEEVNGQLMGVVNLILNASLDDSELQTTKLQTDSITTLL